MVNVLAKKLPFPANRPNPWPMKTLQTAKTSFKKLGNGLLVLTIRHDIIRGVTPKMLAWWFHHLGEPMQFAGKTHQRYLVWHPIDHIHWEIARHGPDGSTGQGAYFRIVESFGAKSEHYIDSIEYVEKCNEEGLTLVKRILGIEVFRLAHMFTPVSGGTQYDSIMKVGINIPVVGRIFNRLIRPLVFSDESGRSWLQHNIEEVGNFEFFLPELYRINSKAGDPERLG